MESDPESQVSFRCPSAPVCTRTADGSILFGLHYDLDLSQMGDEELVVLAQECGYQPARNQLLVRYYEWARRLIAHKARGTRLRAADVLDAQQDATFALIEAIARYDTLHLARSGGCSFRTFVRQVLVSRFLDLLRHLNRTDRRRDRSLRATNALHEGSSAAAGEIFPWEGYARCGGNPAAGLERQESMARLAQVLERLPEPDRRLWEGLTSGLGLRAVAPTLGISYDAAKRQRRRLLAHLAAQLRDDRD
jgi:RNA polymerase sigma factor (sigma-70 family)